MSGVRINQPNQDTVGTTTPTVDTDNITYGGANDPIQREVVALGGDPGTPSQRVKTTNANPGVSDVGLVVRDPNAAAILAAITGALNDSDPNNSTLIHAWAAKSAYTANRTTVTQH